MKRKKEVTIYDLAQELKVSASTVSRALKDHPSIGKKTRIAIKQLARQRGYRLNKVAASLRNQQTNNIGILVSWLNRPFISSLISGVEAAARQAGYNVIISQSQDSYKNEVENVKALFESRICALIVSLGMETSSYDHFSRFIEHDIPLVFVDRIPVNFQAHKVMIDNFAAGFKATQHLVDQGCKRIAHIGGALHQSIYLERRGGYLEALRRNNLETDEDIVLQGDVLNAHEGRNLTAFLLNSSLPPDGIFFANDTAAVSAIQYAKSVNLDVPAKLAIIGFNNDPICTIIDPPLSSVEHPAMELGRTALEQILKIKTVKTALPFQTMVLDTELVVRASSLRQSTD